MAAVFSKIAIHVWDCRNCGHVKISKEVPEVCSACAHPQSYFEIRTKNY